MLLDVCLIVHKRGRLRGSSCFCPRRRRRRCRLARLPAPFDEPAALCCGRRAHNFPRPDGVRATLPTLRRHGCRATAAAAHQSGARRRWQQRRRQRQRQHSSIDAAGAAQASACARARWQAKSEPSTQAGGSICGAEGGGQRGQQVCHCGPQGQHAGCVAAAALARSSAEGQEVIAAGASWIPYCPPAFSTFASSLLFNLLLSSHPHCPALCHCSR